MKTCHKCNLSKDDSDFHKNSKKKDGLNDICKFCRKSYIRNHYNNNKEYYSDKAKNNRKDNIAWFSEFKKNLCCEICGENDIICLDSHHTNPGKKDINVSKAVHSGWGKEKILKEIEKCKILCSNCHRKEHRNLSLRLMDRTSNF